VSGRKYLSFYKLHRWTKYGGKIKKNAQYLLFATAQLMAQARVGGGVPLGEVVQTNEREENEWEGEETGSCIEGKGSAGAYAAARRRVAGDGIETHDAIHGIRHPLYT
jgi:hypothetical protein